MNKDKLAVPLPQFRPGAIIEFEVFPCEPRRGTVSHLVRNSPRSYVAVLSRDERHDGTVIDGICPVLHTEIGINVTHAVRVLSHSPRAMVFEREPLGEHITKRLAQARKCGDICRRGRRLQFFSRNYGADHLLTMELLQRIHASATRLRVQPWELVDTHRLLGALRQCGIVRTLSARGSDTSQPRLALDLKRLCAFLRANINRFKEDTCRAQARHDALDQERYNEDC